MLLSAENCLIGGGATASGGGQSGGLTSENEGPIVFFKSLESLAASLIILLDLSPLSSALISRFKRAKTRIAGRGNRNLPPFS